MQFDCDKCGPVDQVLIDGYPFGDRLLEGCMFIVTLNNNKLTAKIDPSCKEYFEQLNQKKWLQEAVEYVKRNKDDEIGSCCKCADGGVFLKS